MKRQLLLPETSFSHSSVIVSVGTLLTALIGACQALVLVFIVGEGDHTDAFLAAYSLYFVFAIFGGALRSTTVPQLGATDSEQEYRSRVTEVASRILVIAVAAAGCLALISAPAGQVLTNGLPPHARWTAVYSLLILAPAAFCQIHAASLSGALIGARRFLFTTILYVAAGAAGLACSAVLLELLGVLGAPLGLLAGALLLMGGHVLYVRGFGVHLHPRLEWLRQRRLWQLAVTLAAGSAIAIAYQVSLAIALAAISGDSGAITAYSYAFFLITLMLAIGSVPLAVVTLPDLVGRIAREGPRAAEDHLLTVVPYSFAVLAPLVLGYAAFGEPVLDTVFSGSLSDGTISLLYDLSLILGVMIVPGGLLYLTAAVTLALHRARRFLWVALVSLVAEAVAVASLSAAGPRAVAWAHVGVLFLMTVLVMAATYGERWLAVSLAALRRAAPAFALAAVFPLLRLAIGSDLGIGGAVAGAALATVAYVVLAVFLWPSVSTAFVDLVRNPRGSTQR